MRRVQKCLISSSTRFMPAASPAKRARRFTSLDPASSSISCPEKYRLIMGISAESAASPA